MARYDKNNPVAPARPPKRVSWWMRWLTTIRPIVLERRSSEYNPYLEVRLSKGRYALLSTNAIYSYGDLYDNFGDTFKALPLATLAASEVLVLGLGLGSIPLLLEDVYHQKCYYTCVEIDEVVAELAQKYVLQHLKSGMEIVCMDAADFVWMRDEQYDIICHDLFLDANIPTEFESPEFLARLGELLTPNGILIYNRITYYPADREATEHFYREVFLKVFPDATFIELQHNKMLLSRAV